MVIRFSRSTNPYTYLVETNMQHNLHRSSKPNFKHPWSTEYESSWIIHHIHLIRTFFWSLPAMLTRSCQALVETSHLETSMQLISPLSTLRKMTLGCFQAPWHQQCMDSWWFWKSHELHGQKLEVPVFKWLPSNKYNFCPAKTLQQQIMKVNNKGPYKTSIK